MEDKSELTLAQAANLRSGQSPAFEDPWKQARYHARAIKRAYDDLKQSCRVNGIDLEALLGDDEVR